MHKHVVKKGKRRAKLAIALIICVVLYQHLFLLESIAVIVAVAGIALIAYGRLYDPQLWQRTANQRILPFEETHVRNAVFLAGGALIALPIAAAAIGMVIGMAFSAVIVIAALAICFGWIFGL